MVRSIAISVLFTAFVACTPEVSPGDTSTLDVETAFDVQDATSADTSSTDVIAEVHAGDGTTGDTDLECIDDSTFFKNVIWNGFMSTDCATCHVVGGDAEDSDLVLDLGDSDDAILKNMDVLRPLALDMSQGASLLLLKPTGEIPHFGGQRFDTASQEYKQLEQLVARFVQPGGCEDPLSAFNCETAPINPGPSPVRRLTSVQYANTVQELFGEFVTVAGAFPKTVTTSGFSSYAGPNVVSASSVQVIMETTEAVAKEVGDNVGQIAPCQGEVEVCTQSFLDKFGTKIYRRPLSDDEKATLLTALDDMPVQMTYSERVMLLVEMMLQSPQFLYIDPEEGEPVEGTPGVVALSSYGMASRLSYFLWDSMPDAALLERAALGGLNTPEVIWEEVDRMLNDPRAKTMVARFHREWLHLYRLEGAEKDPSLYPLFDAKLVAAMLEEIDRVSTHIIFETPGHFRNLLDTTKSFVNPKLAQLYQTPYDAANGSAWIEADLGSERKGLLNRAAFATAHAYPHASSPIHRGHFILESVLCQKMVIPPFEISELPEAPNGTVKDRLALHSKDPVCASCHERMDPLGLAFEHFDGIGAWRETYEDGQPVNAKGTLASPSLSFKNSASLTDQLKNLELVRDCYATQWTRYALGRSEQAADACSIGSVRKSFSLGGGTVQGLIHAITQSDSFRYRWVSDTEVSDGP